MKKVKMWSVVVIQDGIMNLCVNCIFQSKRQAIECKDVSFGNRDKSITYKVIPVGVIIPRNIEYK